MARRRNLLYSLLAVSLMTGVSSLPLIKVSGSLAADSAADDTPPLPDTGAAPETRPRLAALYRHELNRSLAAVPHAHDPDGVGDADPASGGGGSEGSGGAGKANGGVTFRPIGRGATATPDATPGPGRNSPAFGGGDFSSGGGGGSGSGAEGNRPAEPEGTQPGGQDPADTGPVGEPVTDQTPPGGDNTPPKDGDVPDGNGDSGSQPPGETPPPSGPDTGTPDDGAPDGNGNSGPLPPDEIFDPFDPDTEESDDGIPDFEPPPLPDGPLLPVEPPPSAAVNEPSTLALLLAGALGLVAARRMRR